MLIYIHFLFRSLHKDMIGKIEVFRAGAIRALARITDSSMLTVGYVIVNMLRSRIILSWRGYCVHYSNWHSKVISGIMWGFGVVPLY